MICREPRESYLSLIGLIGIGAGGGIVSAAVVGCVPARKGAVGEDDESLHETVSAVRLSAERTLSFQEPLVITFSLFREGSMHPRQPFNYDWHHRRLVCATLRTYSQ